MSTETERAREIDDAVKSADAAKARADAEESANGEKLDKLLSCLDSITRRMDELDERTAAERAAKGAGAREHTSDADDDDDDDDREKGEPRRLGADSIRADAEEIEHFKRETGSQHVMADTVLAFIQGDADRASSSWGKSARAPMDGERIAAYRRRMAREHQEHSANWRDVDLGQLSGQSLRVAASQIFADSFAASRAPESYGGCLREIIRHDRDTGHRIKKYVGSPSAWMDQFSTKPHRRALFNMDAIKKSMG